MQTRFVPMRRQDMLHHLLDEREDAEAFRHVAQLLHHVLCFEADGHAERLHEAYYPFDPDPLVPGPAGGDPQAFLDVAELVLEDANFRRLSQEELDVAFAEKSLFPILADVPMEEFDVLRMYRRGTGVRHEKVRGWSTLWRWKTRRVEYFERLVVIMQLRPDALATGMEPGRIYVKSFKNVPQADVEMVLPNTRMRLRPLDRFLVGGPLVAGVGWTIIQSIGIFTAVAGGAIALSLDDPRLRALGGVLLVLAGYLWRTHMKVKTRRLEYMQTLSEGLYFRNLANNRSVLDQLLRLSKDEEEKEALLAYHFLSRDGPMDADEVDRRAERWIRDTTGRAADFDVHDGLERLRELGLARQDGRWNAAPPTEGARVLDARWDAAFAAAPASAPP